MEPTVKSKGWAQYFEAIANHIPVLRGYRAKEGMRDIDKVLRTQTAERIKKIKEADLDKLYRYDLAVIERIEELEKMAKGFMAAEAWAASTCDLQGFDKVLADLDEAITLRKETALKL